MKSEELGDSGDLTAENKPAARVKMKKLDATGIAQWTWKPGQSGNPGGRPKHDLAAEIAKACFENNAKALYKAFSKALLRGNAYAFKELADRAFGKLKETHQVDVSPYNDVPAEDLAKEIKRLEAQLCYGKARRTVAVTMLPPVRNRNQIILWPPDSSPLRRFKRRVISCLYAVCAKYEQNCELDTT